MRATHKHTEDKYEQARQLAIDTAQKSLPLGMRNNRGEIVSNHAIGLRNIDFKSLAEAQRWEAASGRRVDWNWTDGLSQYAWRHPKRFELAIWYKEMFLSGLSLGRPTWSANRLRLDFIEASPKITPLSGLITEIVLAAAEVYADVIGASQLRIMNPINDRVKAHYLDPKHGFKFDDKGNFCFREL